MRPVVKSLLLAAGLILLVALSQAEPVSQLKATDYVNDFAHVIDQNTVAQIDDICRQIDEKAHAQIAVVTIHSLDGSDVESYAVDLFKKWGVGSKSTNRGILILLAVQDHKYRVEVGYGLEPILPDGKVGGFGREAVPNLRANDYSGAVMLMTSRIADVIAQDAGVQLTGVRAAEPVENLPEPQQVHLSLGKIILIIIVILLFLFTPLRSLLFWMLLSGGRGGGFGGGGFGGGGFGGGGGGGFGGFGGGSSGGGGASGSW